MGRRRGPALASGVLLAALLASGPGCGPKPVFRTGSMPPRTSSEAGAPGASGVVEEVATAWLGTPYRYGGTDERGIDCSALAQNVLGDLGARLPRTTKAQRHSGRGVPLGDLRAGDLVFFRLESRHVNHVGIALGRDRFIHASSSRGVVVDRLMDDYFGRRVVEARRVLADP